MNEILNPIYRQGWNDAISAAAEQAKLVISSNASLYQLASTQIIPKSIGELAKLQCAICGDDQHHVVCRDCEWVENYIQGNPELHHLSGAYVQKFYKAYRAWRKVR